MNTISTPEQAMSFVVDYLSALPPYATTIAVVFIAFLVLILMYQFVID